jgi:sulfite exporter TauE/SafE
MNEMNTLLVTAASIGFIHTLLGPDHYLPFVAIARARNWSGIKTTLITIFCGLGHVLGSVLLGIIGIALGLVVSKLEGLESVRGDLAAYALIVFGLVYFSWGLRKVFRKTAHHHLHDNKFEPKKNVTLWVLFIVFVLGPCEPLIPILMYPAAQKSLLGLAAVTLVFTIATVTTMTVMVYLLSKGVSFIRIGTLDKYAHALAGLVITFCGVSILLGL